jgi:hypothetical protein
MKIKLFQQFNEEISGTELVGPIGPAYGETGLQNKTINANDTDVIYSEFGSKIYTIDEYNDLYGEYLKLGGSPLDGFTKENIDIILDFLQTN